MQSVIPQSGTSKRPVRPRCRLGAASRPCSAPSSLGPFSLPATPTRRGAARLPGWIDRRPAAIVRPVDGGEVARVVSMARETGLELAVRGGGHSHAGHGTSEGGIVLDLASLARSRSTAASGWRAPRAASPRARSQ